MNVKYFCVFTYVVSILIILVLLSFVDIHAALSVILNADAVLVVFSFVLAGFVLFLKAFRWHMILLDGGHRTCPSFSCVSVFAGMYMSLLTPGRVGEPVRAYFLKKLSGERMSGTVPLVIVERLVDVLFLVLVSLAGVVIFRSELGIGNIQFFEIFAFSAFVVFAGYFVFVDRRVVSMAIKKLKGVSCLKIDADIFNAAIAQVRRRFFLFKLVVISFVVWFFEGVLLYISMMSIGVVLSPLFCFFVVSISFLAGVVTFLPGGLGSLEATVVFFVSMVAGNVNDVAGGVIVYRALSYAALFIFGVASVWFINQNAIGMREVSCNVKENSR
ncbi:MAG: lysylphosphatidylglycerol synthase transmembrane domain-containing protein [archaeon]|nr:lysylphosphatidylglycerol synthase transmembrane domain-containing protein [archaeon]